jgi:hypothetical protein
MNQLIKTLSLLLINVSVACCAKQESTDLRRGTDDCLVAVLRGGVSDADAEALLHDSVDTTRRDGRGEDLRPGVGAVIKVSIGSETGYQICFLREATDAQKDSIRDLVSKSPSVSRVIDSRRHP